MGFSESRESMREAPRRNPFLRQALFVFLLAFSGCSRRDSTLAELQGLCPNLPDHVAGYLVASTDSLLARHARDVGVRAMRNLRTQLDFALMSGPLEGYPERLAVLKPACIRIARVLANQFHNDEYLRDFQERFGKDMATQIRSLRSMRALREAERDTSVSYEEREQLLLTTLREHREMGYSRIPHLLEGDLAKLAGRLGDMEGQKRWGELAIRHARENNDHYMVCQESGDLAFLVGPPRNRLILEEAIDLAERYQFGDQLVRLTRSLAEIHIREGRLTLAHSLYMQAEELCRRQKADTYELDFALATAHRYFEWGAWDLSRRLLDR